MLSKKESTFSCRFLLAWGLQRDTFNQGGFWGGPKNNWVGFFGETLLALYFSIGENLGGKGEP